MTNFELNESLPIKKSVQSIQSFFTFIQKHKMEICLYFIDGKGSDHNHDSCIITHSSLSTNTDYPCSAYCQYELMITLIDIRTGKEDTIRFDGNGMDSSSVFSDRGIILETYTRYNPYTGRERNDTCPSTMQVVLKKPDMDLVKGSIVFKIREMEFKIFYALEYSIINRIPVEIETHNNIEWKRLTPERIADYCILTNDEVFYDKIIGVLIKSMYLINGDERYRTDILAVPIDLSSTHPEYDEYILAVETKNTSVYVKK